MTGSDKAGPRVGKTVCEKTSLLPRSCVVSGHLAAVGVSLLTCGFPATGKGSVTGGDRLLFADQGAVLLPRRFAAGPHCFADAIPGDAGRPSGGNGLTKFAFGQGAAESGSSDRRLLLGDGRLEVLFEGAGQPLRLVGDCPLSGGRSG